MIRLKPSTATYEIDPHRKKVFLIGSMIKGKKMVETRTVFKGFDDVSEAYNYLAEVERMPVWKLRSMSRKLEVHK